MPEQPACSASVSAEDHSKGAGQVVTLKSVCGPAGDAAEPVITVMFPGED